MSTMPIFESDEYLDGRTKQSFKDQTDINKILARAARGDSISHLERHGAEYGDFSDIDDLLTASVRLQRGKEIFEGLPGEIRKEFDQDPGKFFSFVNDPQNVDRLTEILPALAARGDQLGSFRKPGQPPAGGDAAVSPPLTPEPPATDPAPAD